jgi:hypothetical protein
LTGKEAHLLRFDGVREFRGERNVSDGDVVEDEIKSQGSAGEVFTHKARYLTYGKVSEVIME